MNELLIVKLTVLISCAGLKLLGELSWHNAQRFIMPLIIAVGVSIVCHVWWIGAVCLPMIAPLCMGYKDYGKSDGFDRGMWLFLICLTAGLGLTILHHLAWYFYIPYCLVGGIWGATTRGLWNVIIAPLSGALIGSMIFLLH
jgi:hypothetical protein